MLSASALFAVLAASLSAGSELDQLFEVWQKTQESTRTLVVDFTLEYHDTTFGSRHTSTGKLTLVRSPKNGLRVAYELHTKGADREEDSEIAGLLIGEDVYLLIPKEKKASKFSKRGDELGGFLSDWFNPFVCSLDRKWAEEIFRMRIEKQDEWYTYVRVSPRSRRCQLEDGRVAVMKQKSKHIPKNMPRQIWYRDAVGEHTFTIHAWRWNPGDAPDESIFKKPEDREGWETLEWPWPWK
jgi:hypothetical protein